MPNERRIVRQSIPEALVDDLRNRILNGEFPEGDQIRQETLAEEYSVSRMPVREALRRLEAEGFVTFTTHKGATVTELSPDDVSEVFDLRLVLETEALGCAIPAMTPGDYRACRDILAALEDAFHTGDVKRWGALNSQFHQRLYAPAPRPLTKEFIQRLNYRADRYIRLQLTLTGALETAEHQHQALVELSQAKDVTGATRLLQRHIIDAKGQLLAAIAERRDHCS
ncbi:MAG: GntR family transcriptional regulator [Candidatus Competibacterales bacterium]